ncbi:MAG TPA: flagellar hook capping FlgD N-terminal domain-containing protein [Solirubrobacteraceae bacterium]|nr:flagellar hook capping FlgD N-terminal domain-containing protein [Solirubrobacteraceae bacterium]
MPTPINPVTQPPAGSSSADRTAAGSLGKNDFLKLFAAQLQNQDPSSASQPEFMQQMATFSILEQMTNLASAQGQATHVANVGLVGRTVTYGGTAGPVEGVVENIAFGDDGDTLTIGGVPGIPVSSVTGVR